MNKYKVVVAPIAGDRIYNEGEDMPLDDATGERLVSWGFVKPVKVAEAKVEPAPKKAKGE
jgi:hypothetical protein